MYTHFVQGRGAVTALVRLNAYKVLSEQECLHDKACQENAICSPILCMGESSQRSGETERILRLV